MCKKGKWKQVLIYLCGITVSEEPQQNLAYNFAINKRLIKFSSDTSIGYNTAPLPYDI